MSNQQPLYTPQGVSQLINNPDTEMVDVLREVEMLRSNTTLLAQQNAELRAEIASQAELLTNPEKGPLVSISATLQALAASNDKAQRIHNENQQTQKVYQDNMNNIMDLLVKRQAISGSNRLSTPIPFSDKFKGPAGDVTFAVYKAQLKAQMSKFPHAFPADQDRITYAFQCMTSAPAQYFALFLNGEVPDTEGLLSDYNVFLDTVNRLFGDQANQDECEHKLLRLRQNNGTFNDYLIRFRELASRTQWNDAALLACFKAGLSMEIKQILAAQWSKLSTVNETIDAATIASQNLKTKELFRNRGQSSTSHNHYPTRRQHTAVITPATSSGPTPMDLDAMSFKKISNEERQRRVDNKLCLYCGGSGHRVSNCPIKTAKPMQANVISEDSGNEEAEF